MKSEGATDIDQYISQLQSVVPEFTAAVAKAAPVNNPPSNVAVAGLSIAGLEIPVSYLWIALIILVVIYGVYYFTNRKKI